MVLKKGHQRPKCLLAMVLLPSGLNPKKLACRFVLLSLRRGLQLHPYFPDFVRSGQTATLRGDETVSLEAGGLKGV